jgi:hypothetical protein
VSPPPLTVEINVSTVLSAPTTPPPIARTQTAIVRHRDLDTQGQNDQIGEYSTHDNLETAKANKMK